MNRRKSSAALFFLLTRLAAGHAENASPLASVTFEVSPRIVADEPLEGTLRLRPTAGAEKPVSVPVTKGSRQATVALPANTTWEVTPDFERFWALPSPIRVRGPQEKSSYILGLWPKARLAGRVAVEPGERIPAKISVKLRAARVPSRQADVPEAMVDCPVGTDGKWLCELPATLLDLAVRAEGFVPHHRWEVRLPRDRTVDLGRLQLKKGASVSGWVEAEDGALEPARASVRLSPFVAPGAGLAAAEKVRNASVETTVNANGFFQFAGVAPGTYAVEVRQPGFAPAKASPLEVWPGSATSLTHPLLLKRPLRIELRLTPETDWLGKPWRVEVGRAPDLNSGLSLGPAFDGSADEEGRVLLQDQAPGHFRVLVFDSLGNLLFSDFDVPILDPENARHDITIDLITVRGQIRLGDEPLAATLFFGGRHGAVASRMESDRDGDFHGVLPRDGTWLVDIQAEEPALSTHAQVEVDPNPQGKARVSIELPDTQIFGKVTDDAGQPVSQASVHTSTALGALSVRTDLRGAFELRSVPAGYLQIAAEASSPEGRLASEPVTTVALEGQATGPLELRLRKNKPFQGRVQGTRGPVPGAAVTVHALRPASFYGATARTDLGGSFQSRVPESTEAVIAIVSPPGHSLKAFEVPLDGSPVLLDVPAEGGAVEISSSRSEEDIRADSLQTVVFQNGLAIPWGVLLGWAEGHGERLEPSRGVRIPNLAPGQYRVCLSRRADLVEGAGRAPEERQEGCASGYLQAGGVLKLAL